VIRLVDLCGAAIDLHALDDPASSSASLTSSGDSAAHPPQRHDRNIASLKRAVYALTREQTPRYSDAKLTLVLKDWYAELLFASLIHKQCL